MEEVVLTEKSMSAQHKPADAVQVFIPRERQPYHSMWELQKEWVRQIDRRERPSTLILLEHDQVYTLGRTGKAEHLLISAEKCRQQGIEVAEIDRGGDITYHGPGQLVGYPLLALSPWQNDAHLYLRKLEEALIRTLAAFHIEGSRKRPYTGVWVGDAKVAAIGVKFNRGRRSKGFITSHGFALNVNTDLHMFEHIIPCGITEYGVTSMHKLLGEEIPLPDVMRQYRHEFAQLFQVNVHEGEQVKNK
jgi:lipoyl(octanoyl) transferase